MSAMMPEQITHVLTKHLAWLRGETGGARADLSGANLYGADLYGANLYGANLYGADLYGADLSRANLSGANLSRANLSGADLSRANLSGANLYGANLYGANLSGANLYGADLSGANLYGADLYGADLSGADLSGADLFEHWKVETYRDLLWIGPLGSRNDFLMVNLPTLRLKAGCFEGSIAIFLEKVSESHGNNEYAREYGATVEYLKALVAVRNGSEVAS